MTPLGAAAARLRAAVTVGEAVDPASPDGASCPVCGGPAVSCARRSSRKPFRCAGGHEWASADLRKETRTLVAISGVQPTFGERRR